MATSKKPDKSQAQIPQPAQTKKPLDPTEGGNGSPALYPKEGGNGAVGTRGSPDQGVGSASAR